MAVITGAVRKGPAQSPEGTATGQLLRLLLHALRRALLALRQQASDHELQDHIRIVQTACLECMSFSVYPAPASSAPADEQFPALQPTHQAASSIFLQSVSSCSSESCVSLVKELLDRLRGGPASALSGLSGILLLLESHKQQVQQCIRQSMPRMLRGVVQCMAERSLCTPSNDMDCGIIPGVDHGRPVDEKGVQSLYILALRCLESMLGQKALFSSLGAEGRRIPLALVAASGELVASLNSAECMDEREGKPKLKMSMMLLAGLCSATTAMLRHRGDLVAIMWPLLGSVIRLDILVKACAQLRSSRGERYFFVFLSLSR